MSDLSQRLIKELIYYNHLTGVFTWLKRDRSYFITDGSCKSWNTKYANKKAGHSQTGDDGKTYIVIRVMYKSYKAHRLAYLYMTGVWPDITDHKDGDGTNNKWDNISSGNLTDNARNNRLYSCNVSGVVGVGWNKRSEKWRSRISINRKLIQLGVFDDFFEAVCVRKSAENFHRFHANHGSVRPL